LAACVLSANVARQVRYASGQAMMPSLITPMTKSICEYQYPWHCREGLWERLVMAFYVTIRRPFGKMAIAQRIGEFDRYDLVTMYKGFKDAIAEGDVEIVSNICGPKYGERLQRAITRRGRLKWEGRILKSKVVRMGSLQVSQDSHFWHVILKVETEQRLTRMPSEVEPHQLEIVDTEVNTTGYVSPLPTVRSPGWLKKKDRRKRPTKEQIRAPPETDFVLRVRSTPYILNNRETAAQFKTELADWKDRKAREEYERDVARHSMGDEAQGTSDPAPEWQTITEYPVFEIHLEPNTTSAKWSLLGFVDDEGRFYEPVKEYHTPKVVEPDLPPIRLFAGKSGSRPRVALGSTEHKHSGMVYG